MAETIVETQVRILLEQQVADLFMTLWRRQTRTCDLTLIGFDFGDLGEFNNVAFKTSLHKRELVRTVEVMLHRWETGIPGSPEPLVMLPHPDELRSCAEQASRDLPAGVGHAIIIGRGTTTIYIANSERSSTAEMLRNDLLPRWRKEAGL